MNDFDSFHRVSGVKEGQPRVKSPFTSNSRPTSFPDRSRDSLKQLVLKIAVTDVARRYNNGLEDSDTRSIAICNARKLFEELLDADYLRW